MATVTTSNGRGEARRAPDRERRLLRELRGKQAELEHQLDSQRRLLEVNEHLLTMLDPQGVLELIADSLREVVTYHNLTIYRLDQVERRLYPVLARDRFAELIMNTSFPMDRGITGWVIGHGEAQMVNEALADPRTSLIPGTPAEEEALIVVPLMMGGEVMGTLNLGRIGGRTVHFTENDFELTKLFGAQASIALRNALAHRAVAVRADTDALTGLLNHGIFQRRIDEALATTGEADLSLLMLDLDRFRVINESLGHAAGDRLLIAVGERLGSSVRGGDTVARLGGDEFAILADSITTIADARALAERILSDLRASFDLDGHDAVITASIGIAAARRGRTRAVDLVRDADIALDRAKTDRASAYAVFDRRLRPVPIRRFELESDLRHGIERDELELRYQPTVDLVNGHVSGMEALVRWRHPRRGLLEPGSFIPAAEESGLIIPLGRWVLERACARAVSWRAKHPDVDVSVNLSARQLHDPDLPADVAAILEATGLPAKGLTLEITETVALREAEPAILGALRALKELGVHLAIDDFGTGYSPLGYLKRLPVDVLKIDRTFVSGLGESEEDDSIVRALIALGHGLGAEIVAEGIETEVQLRRPIELGCDHDQGFLFARPLTEDALKRLLSRSSPLRGEWSPAARTWAGLDTREATA